MSDQLDERIDQVGAAAAASGFLGMPITGDINRTQERRAVQRPKSDFIPIVQEALSASGVTELRWRQYTPYFNDGEPCIFGAHGLDAVVEGVEIEDFPGYTDEMKSVVGHRPWISASRSHGAYEGPDETRYDALAALNSALQSGSFDDVLLELFGDHATVAVVPGDGIHVEYVEHD